MATEPGLAPRPPVDQRASPAQIDNPELRREVHKAAVWVGIVGLAVLAVYISGSLLVIFGGLVFAAMLDGGARLLGRVLKIGRGWRIGILLIVAIGFFAWLGYFAGSQISVEAAAFPAIVTEQGNRIVNWLRGHGIDVSMAQAQQVAGQVVSGVGTVTRAIGGVLGGVATVVLIVTLGLYVALEPRLYERGVAWMLPREQRGDFHDTAARMAATLRRLMAGRLVGMVFEGVFTWIMLAVYGVPLAALLGIITGLLAFVPNIGALTAGALMILVGFSGGPDMGLYAIAVYFVVQTFDGYVVVPLIARNTVDLAPALVLGFQLIMGILFGVIGLFLADPLLAMIKVALERRVEAIEAHGP
ncbi:MAG: AI-2E family transporter [Croceibacterium sp.]